MTEGRYAKAEQGRKDYIVVQLSSVLSYTVLNKRYKFTDVTIRKPVKWLMARGGEKSIVYC